MRLAVARTSTVFVCARLLFLTLPAGAATNSSNLGASYDSTQSNIVFRVYSSRATQIEVDLYSSPMGAPEVLRYPLTADPATFLFSASIPIATVQAVGITGPVFYGYRAWGPNWPFSDSWTKGSDAGFIADVDAGGNRFNPNKLLMDPYAREISHDPINATWTDGTVFASGAMYRDIDSGNQAPKGILWIPAVQSTGSKPTRAQKDDIVYEVNVRGLTKNDGSVPASVQGTYAGAALKAPYLASLGVTAVEFLPVQETQNDSNDNTPNSDVWTELLGLFHAELLRAGSPLRLEQGSGRPDRRVSGHGESLPRPGPQSLHRRRVQPYGRRRRAWNGNDPTTL